MKLNQIDKVFLGGTCGDSTWRDELEPQITGIDYFNPVVEDWDTDAQKEEDRQKGICNIHLYGLTREQSGAYSFFEIAYSLYNGKKVILLILDINQSSQFKTTIEKIVADLADNPMVSIFYNIGDIVVHLNK